MLLQLLEPGGYADDALQPNTQEPIVGIDLGTTHSLIAFAKDHKVRTLWTEAEAPLLASAVSHFEDTPVVGAQALVHQQQDPTQVFSSFKRFMGDTAHPRESQNALMASTHVLNALKERAEQVLGYPVKKAVVTVPAYFSEAARSATREAARLAGLDVVRLVSEPTAAALAYGLDKGVEGLYLVYDLGGGTFDVSLLRLEKEVFQVVATSGDTHLGGDTLDTLVLDFLLPQHKDLSLAQKNRLLYQVRTLREKLSTAGSVEGSVTFEGQEMPLRLNRDAFEVLAKPVIARTLSLVAQVLKEGEVTPQDLQGIVLVGGATRTPLIIQSLEDFYGKPVLQDIDPDHVVAWGAALQAEGLSGVQGPLLMDVLALSLGIETMGGGVEVLLSRNTPLPAKRTQEFTTFRDGQEAILIHIVQGESEHVQGCRSLARFELSGLAPLQAGQVRLEVCFTMDADGLLSVSAREKNQGIMKHLEIKPTHGLDLEEIIALLKVEGL